MIPYRALDMGAGPVEIGLIASGFAVLSLIAALPIGRWVDRWGPSIFIAGGMTLGAITSLALVWVDSLFMLGVAYAVIGLGHVVNLVAAQTLVGERGGAKGRDERYGTYAMSVSVGQLAGPALAGALAAGVIGWSGWADLPSTRLAPVFLLAFLVDGGAALIGLVHLRRVRMVARQRTDQALQGSMLIAARRVLTRPGVMRAMLVSVIVVSSNDVLMTYLPLLGELAGLSVGFVGLLLSIRAGAALLSRSALGYMLRRVARGYVLTAGMAVAGVSLLTLPFSSGEVNLIVVMILVGFGLGLVQPITMAWVAGETPPADRATALGLRLTGNRAALLTVPAIMGLLAGAAGVTVTFVVMGCVVIGGAASALATSIRSPSLGRLREGGDAGPAD